MSFQVDVTLTFSLQCLNHFVLCEIDNVLLNHVPVINSQVPVIAVMIFALLLKYSFEDESYDVY